jgi:hypothetical protein
VKDYEVHLALNDPQDPIHREIDAALDRLYPKGSTTPPQEKKKEEGDVR